MNTSIETRIKGLKDLCDIFSYVSMILNDEDALDINTICKTHDISVEEYREFVQHLKMIKKWE